MMLLSCSVIGYAQEITKQDEANIEKRVDAFLNEMSAKNYTAVTDFMYPKIFEHTSKQQMFQVFQLLEQAGIELKFNNLELLETTALPNDNQVRYALIKYSMDMELPLSTDELKGMAGFMVPTLESNFGKGNVQYNQKESYIKVKGEKFLLGVEDPAYADWLFLIYDKSFKSALDKTLPANVNQAAATAAY
jgi:hypothetical protein